jgi:nucleolar protein 58
LSRHTGYRTDAAKTDFSAILPEDLEDLLKAAAVISMGTEISFSDLTHIHLLVDQVISISAYRAELSDYLRNRMAAIAPNMTVLVGELVGARLISHAGSLLSLAKQPASTIQILGAEKALFRALKTKHDTPKYGLIFHASLVGQAPQQLKGKAARMVAAKTALAVRVDALSEDGVAPMKDEGEDADATVAATSSVGIEGRAKLERRMRQLEQGLGITSVRKTAKANGAGDSATRKFEMRGNGAGYNTAADSLLPTAAPVASTSTAMAVDGVVRRRLFVIHERPTDVRPGRRSEAQGGEAGQEAQESRSRGCGGGRRRIRSGYHDGRRGGAFGFAAPDAPH